MAHTLEGVDDADRDGKVVGPFNFAVEKFVTKKVRVGEVEFDLPNLSVWSGQKNREEI